MSGSIVNVVIRMHPRSKFATASERSSAVSPPVSTRYTREDHWSAAVANLLPFKCQLNPKPAVICTSAQVARQISVP